MHDEGPGTHAVSSYSRPDRLVRSFMNLLTRVTIQRILFAVALVSATLTRPAAAQRLDLFEPVLLPVTVRNVPGAFGTRWSTELWYRNNSNRRVVVGPLAESDYVPSAKQTVLL